jgi:very-short-patch-repair endonuclease
MEYNYNIDILASEFNTRKDLIVRFLKKHFKENQHYMVHSIDETKPKIESRGGHNKINYLLTKEAYELIQSSYNLKNRYITKVNDVNIVNPLLMSIENATVGFICESIHGIVEFERQYKIGHYYVDVYLPKYNIVIECDEFGHSSYDIHEEMMREEYIKTQLKCHFIRFDPCSKDFQLSKLLHSILKIIV